MSEQTNQPAVPEKTTADRLKAIEGQVDTIKTLLGVLVFLAAMGVAVAVWLLLTAEETGSGGGF
ncbi:hypothetical protein PO878_03935 [Iamia majanohamensis]|uniref:Uncharacterized protein n=1 Tax=Iamia majanohamensis TaxID=467976 RepID=A0AAE9YB57_9ACTN|nr:hypothetical protein [Iamia majanohamensis]WCO67873.1 hypothetical protein PO878_03935 [Iamia majanohamensis]